MARVNLSDDVLRRDAPEPPKAPAPRTRPDDEATPAPQEKPRVYKFTANLDDHDYDQLRALTDAVVDELAPRPVGKGWQAKVFRALVALAAEDTAEGRKMRKRVVAHLRKA